jgi:hypothetical protein
MCAAKNKERSRSSPVWLGSLFRWLLGTGRPLFIVLVVMGVLCGGGYLAWVKLKPRILNSPEYRVGPEQIEITPLPPWIHTDIRAEVLRGPMLDSSLSLMDDDLTERLAKAFAQHPWVAQVESVTKQFPALVKVSLGYRKPVCMIEVPGGLLPVNEEGVMLPSGRDDFSPLEAGRYPRFVRIEQLPAVATGGRWGDPRVVGAAEIAAALGLAWDRMKLDHIETLPVDPAVATVGDSSRRAREPLFAIFTRGDSTRGKSQIVWGYAPGANMLGEVPAAEKVARLEKYLADNDSLDGLQGKRQELDVRTLGKAAPGQ